MTCPHAWNPKVLVSAVSPSRVLCAVHQDVEHHRHSHPPQHAWHRAVGAGLPHPGVQLLRAGSLPPCASRARIAGVRRCLAVPYVLRLCCSWLLWPGVAMPCFARALCGWRRQEGWVETEDFRLLTCEVCARLSSMRAPLPAGRPRGAQDRGHVKPLQLGSGMGHTQVPVPIRRHAASPSRHRLCLRLSTLGCTRCLLCAAEQSSRRGQHPAGASPAGRGKTRARMLSLI